MVSEVCGDCAKRLPKKVTTQSKMQTKRAIIKLNLHGTADYALAALEATGAPLIGRPRPRATLSGTPGKIILAGRRSVVPAPDGYPPLQRTQGWGSLGRVEQPSDS